MDGQEEAFGNILFLDLDSYYISKKGKKNQVACTVEINAPSLLRLLYLKLEKNPYLSNIHPNLGVFPVEACFAGTSPLDSSLEVLWTRERSLLLWNLLLLRPG